MFLLFLDTYHIQGILWFLLFPNTFRVMKVITLNGELLKKYFNDDMVYTGNTSDDSGQINVNMTLFLPKGLLAPLAVESGI